jgi:hypothetical protein
MATPTEFMEDILGMWTSADAEARSAVQRARFTEDIHFQNQQGEFLGYAGLERFSASVRDRFPTARFSLFGAPEAIGDVFRAFWRYGPPEKPEMVTGMDFVIWDGELAKVLYAFVNPPIAG